MSIRSTLIVATAIATLGLGSPAFSATYGGYSNDTGNMMPSYYDKDGWHTGLPPEARAPAAPVTPQRQSATPGRGLYLYAGHGRRYPVVDPVPAANPGGMSNEMMKNDWFWGRANPGH